ncbi:MAG: tRNA lysidine(34) synthetase TilS [Exilibacterium sp.]
MAYSGGLDSTVLLRALALLRGELPQKVSALHINHRLSANSDVWQGHCEATCNSLDIPLITEEVQVATNAGEGIEAAARRARYSVFERYLRESDCLLQAHHLDDQAETLLLRVLRGSGPRGLGAMPESRPLGRGRLLRPLLSFSRVQLQTWLDSGGHTWIEDESNSDHTFDRNFIRHQILPRLELRWPGFKRRWSDTAALCRESDQLNRILACSDLTALNPRRERLGVSVEISRLQDWPRARRFNFLRYWFESEWFEGQRLLYCLPGGRGREARQNQACSMALAWPITPAGLPLALPDAGLSAQPQRQGARRLALARLQSTRVEVRWRCGGERCRPEGRLHSQTLKKLLQEYGLEPWLRDRVPLVYIDGELAAVADLWVCAAFAAAPGEPGVHLQWVCD